MSVAALLRTLKLERIRHGPSLLRCDAIPRGRAIGLRRDRDQVVPGEGIADVELHAPIDIAPHFATTVSHPEIDVCFGRAHIRLCEIEADVRRGRARHRPIADDDFVLPPQAAAYTEAAEPALGE